MKTRILLIVAIVFVANISLAEWEILEVRTAPYTREGNYKGPAEMSLNLSIRNTSDRSVLIWGQDWGSNNKYYHIESFIQGRTNTVWERRNAWMCGSTGKIGWIEVKAGETIRSGSIIFRENTGRQMLLTFRRAYSEFDTKGSEVQLGPFKIPEPKEIKPDGTKESQTIRSETNRTSSATASPR